MRFKNLIPIVICLAFAGVALAEDSPHATENPNVLWYENFEGKSTTFDSGEISTVHASIEGGHAYKLGRGDADSKVVSASVDLSASTLKVPGGHDPRKINIQFMLWTEASGTLTFTVQTEKVSFTASKIMQQTKRWALFSVRSDDLRDEKGKRPGIDESWTSIEIQFDPGIQKLIPEVYIDDFLVSFDVSPAAVKQIVAERDRARALIQRSVDVSGFEFSPNSPSVLKNALKAARTQARPVSSAHSEKNFTAAVIGPTPQESEMLAKLCAAAGKSLGYSFAACQGADDKIIGGFDAAGKNLTEILQKTPAQFALLVIGPSDVSEADAATEKTGRIIERALAAGCIPILCLPPVVAANLSAEEQGLLQTFNVAVSAECDKRSIPYIDESFALKAADMASTWTPTALDGLAKLSVSCIKHISQNVKP